jgi:lipopolysaccharide transport protein LptA
LADRLKIFYEGTLDESGKADSGENPIKKIEAEGNVSIRFQNRNGITEKAVYDPVKKVLVLTGENTRLFSEGNHISGQTITFYRTEERITVERGEQKRVEAEFYAKGAGIQ